MLQKSANFPGGEKIEISEKTLIKRRNESPEQKGKRGIFKKGTTDLLINGEL